MLFTASAFVEFAPNWTPRLCPIVTTRVFLSLSLSISLVTQCTPPLVRFNAADERKARAMPRCETLKSSSPSNPLAELLYRDFYSLPRYCAARISAARRLAADDVARHAANIHARH